MKSLVLIDVVSHLLISIFLAIVFWPYLGAWGLIVVLIAAAYLIRAWLNADLIVAGKVGFRPPTLVQRRYLDYLNTGQEVLTHPSFLPIAGTLVSSRRRLILLTSGVFRELSENDIRHLIAELSHRDNREWTFHLATGGVRLFSKADDGPFAQSWGEWGRKTLLIGIMGGIAAVFMAVVIAAPLSGIFGHAIDISAIVPFAWLPFAYLVAMFVWRRGNAMLIKPATGNWNRPIVLEQATFLPMSQPLGSHANLNILRNGLLIAEKAVLNEPFPDLRAFEL
jgi:hypothetical protein